MQVNLNELKEITKKISAVCTADSNAIFVNISADSTKAAMYFSMSTGDCYISMKLPQESAETFEAAVDAKAFVDIINSLSAENINLNIKDNSLLINAGKSKYKLPMAYVETSLWSPTIIAPEDPQVSTTVSIDILNSIYTVNAQELARVSDNKIKNESSKLYYLSNSGCFTSANNYGACLNKFELQGQLEVLLTKKLVKLFKLFDTDVDLYYSTEITNGLAQNILMLANDTVRLGALTPADKTIRANLLKMVYRLREYAGNNYQHILMFDTKELAQALARLAIMAKHAKKANSLDMNAIHLKTVDNTVMLSDDFENSETVALLPESVTIGNFAINLELSAIRSVVDLCQSESLTIRGNQNGIIIVDFDNVSYFLATLVGD